MNLNKMIELDEKYYMNTFGARTPVCFEKGEGMYLYDTNGKRYSDFFGGIAVNALGYAHKGLTEALKSQLDKGIIHTSSLYYIASQAKLAEKIVEKSCCDRVFFGNSGAEANEAAIKLAKIYFYKQGIDKNEIITIKNSFHGRTLATLAATGQKKYQMPYQPNIPGFTHVDINDIEALKAAVTDKTAAIIIEPIQGESGVFCANTKYIKEVRKICDEKGIILIFDEVQTGIGRTGKLFAYEHLGVTPDIFTLAKALGGGIPIGAMCAKEFVAKGFEPGDHGSTFGGNPFACTAALAVLEAIEKEGLLENAAEIGEYFALKLVSTGNSKIKEVRGKGLMIGVALSVDAKDVKNALFERGFLTGAVGAHTLRILPPLIVGKKDVDEFIKALQEVLA